MNKASAIFLALLWLPIVPAADGADVKTELGALLEQTKVKEDAGKTSKDDYAEDLKNFDALLAEHKEEKTDEVAMVLLMKAALLSNVCNDDALATADLKKLEAEFPGTRSSRQAERLLTSISDKSEVGMVQSHLAEGLPFAEFHVTGLDGKPLSPADYKGKVVLVDFWATWCGPCVAELPNVLKVYQQYHDKGFEVIGVSLDSDKDKLTDYIKEKQLPWPQYFDGKGWDNKLATAYGISSIPATYLLGKDGKIIGKGVRGDALTSAVSAVLDAK